MLDATDLLCSIKKASMDAVEASKPAGVVFGNVISIAPLQINIEQKLTLGTTQLILTRNVTNYTVNMVVNHATGSATHAHQYTDDGSEKTTSSDTHSHAYTGTKSFTVNNSLAVGDKVVMMRMQGGQRYVVIDRVVTA